MMRQMLRGTLPLLAAAALTLACGDDEPTAPNGPPDTNQVSVIDNSFNPSANRIDAGQTVTWTWNGGNPHNVTFDDGSLTNSQTQTQGTFEQTFDAEGEFSYYCTVHGRAVMSGRVVVGDPSSSGSTGAGGY